VEYPSIQNSVIDLIVKYRVFPCFHSCPPARSYYFCCG